jgi:hypothetical protein
MALDSALFDHEGANGNDPSLKLPPLMRDRPLPSPSPSVVHRTMHQLQLEMEYDAEESDDSDRRSMQGLGAASKRHATNPQDSTTDLAAQEIHALCIFDDIPALSIGRPKSQLIDALSGALPKRKWGRWRWRGPPLLSDIHVMEGIFLYERGVELSAEHRCSNCRAGKGVSPQCVVVPSHLNSQDDPLPCSNCIYDGTTKSCNALGSRGSRTERRSDPLRDPDRVVDHLAVLDLIARLKRPSGSCKDHSLPERARRIERAALHIAQAAREWGERMAE